MSKVIDNGVDVTARLAALESALGLIRHARDYRAEHGRYPADTVEDGLSFDDWAADVADRALGKGV